MRFIAPDDGNTEDRTVAEVPLATPVAQGQTINVQIAWSSRVPRTFARTGAIGNYFFLAHWFPKIGVLQDSGWNCHQFHAGTEFFADFGVYDVRLTVPTGWIVGATGAERSRRDGGDRTTTHSYYAEDVHDFAWTTSPDYVERLERFTDPALPPVAMRLLLQPEHTAQATRHFTATRATLKHYGEWYGPYPYANITIIDPAWQSGAGGMEYPMLFTAGTRLIVPRRVAQPEGVTVHEAGHQFWYGIVATNEFEHAWLDEGLNTFSTARVLDQFFGPQYYSKRYFGGFIPWTFPDLRLSREVDGNRLAGYRMAARSDVQATPSWRYWPGTGGAITYNKTALWLYTLERRLGWEKLQRILSTFFDRYAFQHPQPQDFFAVANEVSGTDLTPFFDQVYRSASVFDYGVDLLESERVTDRGYFGETGKQTFSANQQSSAQYRTTLVVRRFGDGILPVDVRIVFENNEDLLLQWDGRDTWKLFQIDRPVRAVSAHVDPDRTLLLDVNYTNNSRSLTPKTELAARKWSLVWLIWLQDHLLTYGFFI
jgi:Peptidase family M1 domain